MNEMGRLTEREILGLARVLDHATPPWPVGIVPPLGHWLAFPPTARESDLGSDGHPVRDEHPDLPRRMWAGSRVRFLADIPVGAPLERVTSVVSEIEKHGRSGRMVFVTLRHDIACGGEAVIAEEQDIVYRAMPEPGDPLPAIVASPFRADAATVVADAAMLFRFSALTYNAHRIHYDLPYAREVECYPGLIVHGPLIATLLMDRLLRHRQRARLSSFTFRAVSPLFAGETIDLALRLEADHATLTASGPRGVAVSAEATVSDRS